MEGIRPGAANGDWREAAAAVVATVVRRKPALD